MFKRNKKNSLFDIQSDFEPEDLSVQEDDVLFNEALSQYADSANQPTRNFLGSVIQKKRIVTMLFLVCFVLTIFTVKTFSIQVVRGAEYRDMAENNRIKQTVIPAQRGIIYDRNGVVLARNIPIFKLVLNTKFISNDPEEIKNILYKVSQMLNLNFEQLSSSINFDTNNRSIVLIDDLTYDSAIKFLALKSSFPFVDLEIGIRREYITSEIPSLSHIIGYTGTLNEIEYDDNKTKGYRSFDIIGKNGLEQMYEMKLRGEFGIEKQEVNAMGSNKRIISKKDKVDGENIVLSIDSALQKYIENSLTKNMTDTPSSKASIIVMSPKTGEIYALVSWPAFDSNDFSGGIESFIYKKYLENEDRPLFARATSGEFPSGSTIKPVFAAGALEDGIITKDTKVVSTGGIRIGLWFFPDWRAGGHGVVDVYKAIYDSVNTFFYLIGGGDSTFQGMGVKRLMEHAQEFGFGERTGIDLPTEADGFLPSKEWKLNKKGEMWYIGDTYHVAIGQGDFLSTPLQIARATAVFANNGYLVTPHLNKNIEVKKEKILDEEYVEIIDDAMRMTITKGTAQMLNNLPITSAGKTGTSQWNSTKNNHSWYTGFAPFEDPEIVITVLMEEGAKDYLAVPVAKDILLWWSENSF